MYLPAEGKNKQNGEVCFSDIKKSRTAGREERFGRVEDRAGSVSKA